MVGGREMDGGREDPGLERLEKAFWLPCWENAAGLREAPNSVRAEAPSEKPSGQEERRAASLLKWLQEEWESSGLSRRLKRGPSAPQSGLIHHEQHRDRRATKAPRPLQRRARGSHYQ